MELKQKFFIELSRGEEGSERNYQFILPINAPLGEAYDVCHEILQKVVKMAQEASDRAAQKKEEEEKEVKN